MRARISFSFGTGYSSSVVEVTPLRYDVLRFWKDIICGARVPFRAHLATETIY